MNLGNYRLLTQLGAGCDGVAYRAMRLTDEGIIEIRLLAAARTDADRWRAVARRLRCAALLQHPDSVQLLELDLEHDPPWVALEELAEGSLADDLREHVPLPAAEALVLGRELAEALAAAHRLGLAHGAFGPGSLRRTPDGRLKLDFTGLDVGAGASEQLHALEAACHPVQSPEAGGGMAEDVYGLGAVIHWLLSGRAPARAPHLADLPTTLQATMPGIALGPGVDPAVNTLLDAMLTAVPADRPLVFEVLERLARLMDSDSSRGELQQTRADNSQGDSFDRGSTADPVAGRVQLGRYVLKQKLGQGGMGAVYRAEDPADGSTVAIKVLHPKLARHPASVRRFHKEARLLAEANNPHVANLLEVNEDDGIPYLVLEFVAGSNLGEVLEVYGPLPEPAALAVLSAVTCALAAAHERGIVHRDIKPDNILLQGLQLRDQGLGNHAQTELDPQSLIPKLTDFGLARHVVETESLNLTQAGMLMGTPLYMAPEQCTGAKVDARADVYALGATLYHVLTGQPPFLADTVPAVIALHCNEPPPNPQKFNPKLSDGICRVVEKALAKAPDARYPNAGALLHDLERLQRGEPTSIAVHPRLPECAPESVLCYEFTWQLQASPRQLWPHVSNTERLNRAAGLSAVQFSLQVDPEETSPTEHDQRKPVRPRVRRFGTFRATGVTFAYEEQPFEWIEARRMGVLREYSSGPFKWLVSVTDLAPRTGGGTLLAHTIRLEPRGLLGRTAAAVAIGVQARRALERIYRRIDAALTGKLGDPAFVDLFTEADPLTPAQQRCLDELLDQLGTRGIGPEVVERLGDFLAHASAQEVVRVRPLALARRLRLEPDHVIAACLQGASTGLFVLYWDILCPVCRIPSEVHESLRALREHGHCEVCNVDFELDFANSVELVFRAHPQIRQAELKTYCLGGPAHSPHVAAQMRVAPGEQLDLELALPEGAYRLRGPQLPFVYDFRVQPGTPLARLDLLLSRGPDASLPRVLAAGSQVVGVRNDFDQEIVIRVERLAPREDALTAARASALALFRELFPQEVLAPGQLVSVATMTFLVTALEAAGLLYESLGDARAFGLLHEHFRRLVEIIRAEGGATIKTVGEGLVAAFTEPVSAVRAGLRILECAVPLPDRPPLRACVGVHRGPALAATLNDHLDYFGSTMNQALRLPGLAEGGGALLTQATAADPAVAALLRSRGLQGELLDEEPAGWSGGPLLRVVVSP